MNNIKTKSFDFPYQFIYVLFTFLLGILFFAIFRLVIYLMHCVSFPQDVTFVLSLKSFFMGLRFDCVVSSYVLLIPLFLLALWTVFNVKNKYYYLPVHYFVIVLYSLSFLICSADIPYFSYFFERFNITALTWMDSPKFVANMILKEPSYILYGFVFLIFEFGFIWLMRVIYKKTICKYISDKQKRYNQIFTILISLCLFALCYCGIRGRLAHKSPIRVGTAYFSNNDFFNKLGLNPVFTFGKSWMESLSSRNNKVHFIDDSIAEQVANVEFQNRNDSTSKSIFLPDNTNVIVVMMESMASCKMGHFGNPDHLTPNLDTIINHSLSFEKIYSAGIHTYNGVYSTLFAYPAILHRHTMKYTVIPQMEGLPNVLKNKGYETYYFTTHDDQFDNIGGFLHRNDVQNIISQKDYPKKEVLSSLGVPDHIMFNKVVETLNNRNNSKPFFAAILTASDHGPYMYPNNISLVPKQTNIKKKMVEYADWAIGQFINNASRCSWFNNTLFVFVADHGAVNPSDVYDIQLSYHHVPLIFYCPKYIVPQKNNILGLQIDIAPTVLSMLDTHYNNETMGMNLLGRPRQYAYFSSDDKIGVMDSTFLYIWRSDHGEGLYKYTLNDKTNYIKEYPERAAIMKKYGFSMIQYAQYRIMKKQSLK